MFTTENLIKLGKVYRFYIGQDNVKNVVDRVTVYDYIGSHFDGATFQDAKGMYKNDFEDSLVVTIATDLPVNDIINKIADLRILLQQESIGIEYNNKFYLI